MNLDSKFKTLGLTSEASWDEVKSAFRRLARTHHPDIAGPEGSRRFSEITQAYMELKETIAPGAIKIKKDNVSNNKKDINKNSFWKRIINKFFQETPEETKSTQCQSKTTYHQEPYVHNPVRERFINSLLDRMDSQIGIIYKKRDDLIHKNRVNAFLLRLKSKHPAVALLALQQLSSSDNTKEIIKILEKHFKKVAPPTEVLGTLLSISNQTTQSEELGRILCSHIMSYSVSDALLLLRWIRRKQYRSECLPLFLSHTSEHVVGAALSLWQPEDPLPTTHILNTLIQKDHETILLPLLRLIKYNKEKSDLWIFSFIEKLSKEHTNPAVRVWAASIVRERELS